MRSNRADVAPIGQQNPPRRLKLLVLHEKTGKNTDFYLAQNICHLVRRVPYSAYYGHLATHYGGPWCSPTPCWYN